MEPADRRAASSNSVLGALILGIIFTLGGLAMLIVGGATSGRIEAGASWGLIGSGVLFAVIGIVSLLFWYRMRWPKEPESTPPDEWDQLVAQVEQAFADSPYTVETTETTLRVRADLADARFLTFGAVRRVSNTFTSDVVAAGPGLVEVTDQVAEIEWTVSPTGDPSAHYTGKVQSGMVIAKSSHFELGANAEGVGPKVAYSFSTEDVRKPLREAIKAAGFRKKMSSDVKMGLVMAGFGIGVALAVGIALIIVALTGGFS